MDGKTLKYYQDNAADIFEKYQSAEGGISNFFSMAFPEKCKVLDLGAGSGRDMKQLLDKGYDVFGIEPCSELRNLAQKRYPELSERLLVGQLPGLDESFNDRFDGVICSAVLMHVPKEQLFDTAFAVKLIFLKTPMSIQHV